MAPTRADLEGVIAKQYGFNDYAAFRVFFAQEFGKGFLRSLEQEITKREKETGDEGGAQPH